MSSGASTPTGRSRPTGRCWSWREGRSSLADREEVIRQTRAALDAKTKPPGSLGRLEEIAVRVAAIRGTPSPGRLRAAIVLAAADHGVAARGVSAYRQEVTGPALANIVASG